MKALGSLCGVFLFAIAILTAATPVAAQDPAKVAPNNYKCTFENERVRVCEVSFKPGETIATHSHPDHFVYVMAPGKMKLTHPDGTSKEVEAKKGDVLWTPAETHSATNTGTTEIKGLVVELKK